MTNHSGFVWKDGIGRRNLLRLAAGGTAGIALLGGLSRGGRANDGEFRIGWVRPTTGRLASSFAPLYVGGLIAIEEINAAGGILGRKVVRVEEDDEASPAKEPAIVRKLQEAGVSYVVGPTGSSQSLSSLAVTTAGKIIQSTYAAAVDVADGRRYPYHYQLMFNTDQQGEVAATYMVETLKVRKIGILQENTAFGEQATASTRAVLKRLGIEPVSVQVYPINAPDLAAYVGNLQKAGAEGIVAWIANIPNGAMAFNAMAALKWFPPVTGHSGLFLNALFDLVPAEALKNVYATYYRTLTWTDSEQPGERQKAFAGKLAAYPEAKGVEVNVAASPYYDFLHLLKTVIEAEKTFEVEKIKRAIDSVKAYDGLLGTMSFSPENHCGIRIEDIALASIASGQDPRAMGCFRERAKA